MKKIAISALILMSFFKVFSQIEVGHYTDSQGLPIEGYFDELEYANNSGITCTITSNEYEKGYYFDKSGIKFIGWLKLDSKDFSFKEVEKSQPKRLTADDVETFVIAKDSFFATSNFRIEGLYFDKTVKADKPRFVKHVCSFDENNFAIYFEFSQGGITSNYIYKKKGQEFWVNIPESSDKSEFKEFWGKKFESYASIRAALTSRNFKGLETLCLIKRAEYEYKLTMKQPIYFDRWWNELQNSDPDGFTAEIDDVKDTIFTISYFQSGVRIAQIQYSQFSPDFKNGYSRWYYPDGTLRKEGIWEDNKLKSSTSFFTNAQKHYNYNVVQSGYTSSSKIPKYYFNEVYSEDGESLLDENGSGIETFTDSFNDRIIKRRFRDHYLEESSFVKDGKRTYQWTGAVLKRASKLSSRYNVEFAGSQNMPEAINDRADGRILYALTILDNQAYSFKALNELHPEVNKKVDAFFTTNVAYSQYPMKFNKLKAEEKVTQYEVVIPYTLTVQRLFRQQRYYQPYYHHMHYMPVYTPQITVPTFR